ncbi:chemotaxis protein CheX [Alteromonas sp. 1_MG-2023]|uniref:chemotaxis protein CheX n=1 Tax=unclassified Alteromonas TaxID=2614992 RepID=UPI0026E324EE|nr:chemotaxis protein CheX [Alteromonas sp. 1_MG-2023]MDO6477476.1 chemotaxis protein CheX [Alteromonas sp. 1_MG-2023]
MNVEFVNPFINGLLNVMETMAQTTLKPGKPKRKQSDVAQGDVSGLIGMVGPQVKGSMSITFDEGLALTIMERMVGERPEKLDAEVGDMVGEVTNMICGNAKRELAEKGFDFGMATPIVVSGKQHTISHQVDGSKLIMPFMCDAGLAHMEICFDK